MQIPPKGLTKSLRINDLSGLNPDIVAPCKHYRIDSIKVWKQIMSPQVRNLYGKA